MFSTPSSEFVNLITPLHERLNYYDRTSSPTQQPRNDAADPAKAVPKSFIDAMLVREEVFVKGQSIPVENEADDDDPRSFHWVAYASLPAKSLPSTSNTNTNTASSAPTSTKLPIGTIRLVPPPHSAHHNNAPGLDRHGAEAYVKLGRLAVIPEFRKTGVAKLLIETALAYAREHPFEVGPSIDPAGLEAVKKSHGGVDAAGVGWAGVGLGGEQQQLPGTRFRGLVLVHSQVGAVKVWSRHGFEKDGEMGEWDEEGIMHVGMWRRVEISEAARRKSKVWGGNGGGSGGSAVGGGGGGVGGSSSAD